MTAFPKPSRFDRPQRQREGVGAGKLAKPKPIRDAKFRAFVRLHPCAIKGKPGHRCMSPIDAAHIEGNGMGTKADDLLTIALCRAAHMLSHSIGWKRFEERFEIDRYAISHDIRQAWFRRTR